MQKRTREKIALVGFVLLVVLAGVVLTSYFSTGRSWSVAASFVDDSVGRMEGYTALAYAGVLEPSSEDEADEASAPGGTPLAVQPGSSAAQDASDDETSRAEEDKASGSDGLGASDAAGAAADVVAETNDAENPESAGEEDDASSAGDSEDTENSEDAEGSKDSEEDTVSLVLPERGADDVLSSPPSAADSIGLGILSLLPRSLEKAQRGVYVSDVRALYEEKGACVLTLDFSRPDAYSDPQILYVGGKRIGVYSVSAYTTRARLKTYTKYFAERDVDVVVCVTPRASLLATYEGTNVVIVTTDIEDVSTNGQFVDDALVVQSPQRGEVGVILLSTNNVPAAKVVSSI